MAEKMTKGVFVRLARSTTRTRHTMALGTCGKAHPSCELPPLFKNRLGLTVAAVELGEPHGLTEDGVHRVEEAHHLDGLHPHDDAEMCTRLWSVARTAPWLA